MKILFGVFDWGLGHATRDTPLIEALLSAGHAVDVLSTGRGLKILHKRFGQACRFFDVPSIQSPYTKTRFFVPSFIAHLPSMLLTLSRARKQTLAIIRRNRYDLVISDCRYDVYDQVENSILINHQLRFHAFAGGEQIIERWLACQLNHYRVVAVPDYERDNLSGRLSHDLRYFDGSRIRYIGILSHLRRRDLPKDLDYFISLTGPEPQRTLLERAVREQVKDLAGRIVIAGGNPDHALAERAGDVEFYSYLDQPQQEEMMNRAKFLVSRSGYTTIMELCEIGLQRALLIPTPGQTEQVYLGEYLERKGYFPSVSQYALRLKQDVQRAAGFSGYKANWPTAESVRRFMALCHP